MRSRFITGLAAAVVVAAVACVPSAGNAATFDPCGAGSNPITCENSKTGSPIEDWYSENSWGDIEGFTTKESVQPGETLQAKVNSPASTFRVSIYRLGYYGGLGARKMPTSPTTIYAQKTQDPCLHDSGTGLVDCGNWTTNVTWTVPSDAVSGVYLLMLDQTDNNGFMPYPFVVTNNSSHSDILVQTSDQTWQAYNDWGGQNLYQGGGPALDGRAYKVSYNRPLRTAGDNGVFSSEFPMIQFLERNGYNVSYASSIDVSNNAAMLLQHKVFMSSGHDEYWNQKQWDNVTAAKAAGVNLAFFSGNEVFWRTRFEPSISTGAAADRTLVCYKETKLSQSPPNGTADPSGQWTGTWVDTDGAGKGGNKPPNQLTGTLFTVNGYRQDAITVPAAYKDLRLWRGIPAINNLQAGQVSTLAAGSLGYEWDSDKENAVRPAGAVAFSSTTLNLTDGTLLLDQDHGNNYGNGVETHSLMMYRDPTSKALVFGAGTVQWAWGLAAFHSGPTSVEDKKMQQATVNLLADMSSQPLTLMAGLNLAAKSTDTTGPNVTITSPASGANVPAASPVNITGTAAEVGGGQLGRVEISTDGGTTWAKANGLGTWSYTWTPGAPGAATIKVRASDDSLNLGAVASLSVTVGSQQCPCSTYPASTVPTNVDSFDSGPNELGVKFRVPTASQVLGVKFYKSAANTGTHLGKLWSSSGQLLAQGEFSGESATGWQTMTFANPVPVAPNTTYIVSYYTPTGRYSYDSAYFATKGAGQAAITQLKSGVDGPNGVYKYGGGFPNQSWNDTNYWVDAIVTTAGATSNPPTVTARTPAANATDAGLNTAVTATFSQALNPSAIQFTLTTGGSTNVPGVVSYNATTKTATLQPTGVLSPSTTYQASVQATDAFGNAMLAPSVWSFTTGGSGQVSCPCSLWNDTTVPANASASEVASLELGMRFTSAVDGKITGVRFYKSAENTGPHSGTLWSNTGQQLATGTFENETASGWQTMTFSTPVSITANTPYVVSYHTTVGHYAYNSGFFGQPMQNYPLTGVSENNGLFRQSNDVVFPTNTWNATNYWVDVIFTTP
ncbi:DUF4082 domain-containing protein [Dactylosporangium sp. CS-047395]|uniref:DUF4082 domain-containing protein n=1 Tax=Dactylosporangium sp. CS-047395 TaxID=3239936 RepID=UPI003D8A0F49